jgi:hypothetical protein
MNAKEMILEHIKELDRLINMSTDNSNKAKLLNAKSIALLALRAK